MMSMPVDEAIDMSDFHKSYEKLCVQHFMVSGSEGSVITAAHGLKVTVDPSALVNESGKRVKGTIQLSIIELTSSNEFFKMNAATVSDGRLLASGGSYFIGMESGGQKLHVKKGCALRVDFPVLKKGGMQLFYGTRDSLEDMNWKPTGISLTEPGDSFGFIDSNYQAKKMLYSMYDSNNKYSYSLLTGHIFSDLKASVYLYDKKITLAQLLDKVNREKQVLCLDSISFWPKNLPAGRILDTNYLVNTYGPRFQYILKKCTARHQVDKDINDAGSVVMDSMLVNQRVSSLAESVQKYYAPVMVNSLGWLNCDRYYNDQTPVEMELNLPVTISNNRIEYFVIFKKFNGLLKGSLIAGENKIAMIGGLPSNEEVTLVAFTRSKGQFYHARADFRIRKDRSMALDFKEISMGEMNKIFGRNIRI
jgi:hypothetical protein